MPWTPNDAERHTHKATTRELQELWAKVANEALERTGDEGRAIRCDRAAGGSQPLGGESETDSRRRSANIGTSILVGMEMADWASLETFSFGDNPKLAAELVQLHERRTEAESCFRKSALERAHRNSWESSALPLSYTRVPSRL